ncbi:glycosyltransferase family 2 protein [Arcanobacterium haemolyticum]|nr:glycosyltransferase family 2 protein [Arcanobacterium haemolyticum]
MISRVAAVVVTYNSDEVLLPLVRALSQQCDSVIVVDNGSENADIVRGWCDEAGATFVPLSTNVGIAAAQNIGIGRARAAGADFILLSDDDSLPSDGLVSGLVGVLEQDARIAAAGPLPVEEREGGDQLAYCARTWGPKRAHPDELEEGVLDVAFLIASGCMIRVSALDTIGLMDEALFIDHVDLEWGVRARNLGFRLVCVPALRLSHSLGDDVVLLPGRDQPIHVHPPIRNYYIARNTIELIKRTGLLPPLWRLRYIYWLAKYTAFNALLVDRLPERRKLLLRGICDGIRSRLGRF